MNDPDLMKLLEDLTIVFNPTSHEIGRRALVILERLKNPTPTGETVRVRAGVWISRRQHGRWYVTGSQDGYTYHASDDNRPDATIEADIPLPRIPVVEARVVEGDQS